MTYVYDDQNVFAKILRGEIPNDTVLDSAHTLAFRDIAPQAPEHIVVIPKGPYVCLDHFAEAASDAEIVDFTRALGEIARTLGLAPTVGDGFRAIANAGDNARQEVPHYHMHILGGRDLGGILAN